MLATANTKQAAQTSVTNRRLWKIVLFKQPLIIGLELKSMIALNMEPSIYLKAKFQHALNANNLHRSTLHIGIVNGNGENIIE